MESISSVKALKVAILALEIKKIEQGKMIKEQLNDIKENLRPANLIRNSFVELVSSNKVVSNLLVTLAGVSAGYISRRMIGGKGKSPFRKIAGNLINMGVTVMMARKPNLLSTIGKTVLGRVFSKRREPGEVYQY
jgi:hypothetical protein